MKRSRNKTITHQKLEYFMSMPHNSNQASIMASIAAREQISQSKFKKHDRHLKSISNANELT